MNENCDPMHANKCVPSAKDAEENEFCGTHNEDQGEEDSQLESELHEHIVVKTAVNRRS